MSQRIFRIYEKSVIRHPILTLLLVGTMVAAIGYHATEFRLDASAESLTLEHDANLQYYRDIRSRFGSDDYLVITYQPQQALFSNAVLDDLAHLRNELSLLPSAESVTSILDVPLLESPPLGLDELAKDIPTLGDKATDRTLAQNELLQSPLYRDLLISGDARTTAIQLIFAEDENYFALRNQRNELRRKKTSGDFSADDAALLKLTDHRFQDANTRLLEAEGEQIIAVRKVLSSHAQNAELHLGGVPMITADSIDFIRHDLMVFGAAVLLFLVFVLAIAFHRPRWVILPLLVCVSTCLTMVGLLGLLEWRVTVVSSNFLSLVLILTLAITLHIIVRYRELHEARPQASQQELVSESIRRIATPCLYTVLTTMVAFGSLVVSGIRPVMDFGWMMVIGIAVAFVFSFTIFPAALLLLKPGTAWPRKDITAKITAFFYRLIYKRSGITLTVFALVALISAAGISRLTVENRFIDYYHKSTEIYRGMEVIDKQLGGTTPLDVIIDAPLAAESPTSSSDEFEDIFAEAEEGGGLAASSYWYNRWRLDEIAGIHDYLDALPETGKVLSLATAMRVFEKVDKNLLKDNLQLSLLYKKLPDNIRAALFNPYLSADGNQLRFGVRVFESDKSLRRAALLEKIPQDLVRNFGLRPEQVHLSGMLVLYNNMLQSLFRSQVLTLGAVFLAITIMFFVLFRSPRIAIIGIIPNMLSAAVVLGLMGWLKIPLDIMTITIAAITIGIGVDDTIHYIHRYESELRQDDDPWATIRRCHSTIGRAMYYTSITIMLGFSILMLSRFVPTIYFGLLTGFAMSIALLADLTLLPVLLSTFPGKRRSGRGIK